MLLFQDCETTGLTSKSRDFMAQPGIVQLAAIKLDDDLNEVDMFQTLVNPELSNWEEGAIKTHGITPEHVKDAPTFFEVGPAFARFSLGCDTWGGFNCEFDRDVLWYQLEKYGLSRNYPWPVRTIDVMKLAGRAMETQGKRGTKNPKLTEAFEFFKGRTYEGAHDALADIRATAEVYRALLVCGSLSRGQEADVRLPSV